MSGSPKKARSWSMTHAIIPSRTMTLPSHRSHSTSRGSLTSSTLAACSASTSRTADELAVHRDHEASVIVLEYAVHGQAVQTGRTDDNHFVSVITVKDRKVTHWRD
jgi:hypothetical protein